jgi:hypothetical protein
MDPNQETTSTFALLFGSASVVGSIEVLYIPVQHPPQGKQMLLWLTCRGFMTPQSGRVLDTAHAAISIFVCPHMYLWKTLVQWSTGSEAMPAACRFVSFKYCLR